MQYIAKKTLRHNGVTLFPGDIVADAREWKNFRFAMEQGFFEAVDDDYVSERAQVKELESFIDPESLKKSKLKRANSRRVK